VGLAAALTRPVLSSAAVVVGGGVDVVIRRVPDHVVSAVAGRGAHVRAEVERLARELVGRIVPPVVDAAVAEMNLTQLAARHVDLDLLAALLDVDAIVARADLNAVITRVDIAAILDRVDPNTIVDRLDLDEIVAGVDLDAVVARIDLEAIVKRVDPDAVIARWMSTAHWPGSTWPPSPGRSSMISTCLRSCGSPQAPSRPRPCARSATRACSRTRPSPASSIGCCGAGRVCRSLGA